MADIVEQEQTQEDSWSPFAGLQPYNEGLKETVEPDDAPVPPQVSGEDKTAAPEEAQGPKSEEKKEPENVEGEEKKEKDFFEEAKGKEDTEEAQPAPTRGRKPMTSEDYEARQINSLYDVFVENYGWKDIPEDQRPRNAEEFVNFVSAVIADNSTPQYANEELQRLDEYVRQGGSIASYMQQFAQTNYENLDISSEANQKYCVAEMLRLQGWNTDAIRRKVEDYAKGGVLENEAKDAAAVLSGYSRQARQQQLQQQQQMVQQEQQITNQVIQTTAETLSRMDNIGGIPLTYKDKRELFEYMFRQNEQGVTQFMQEYSSSPVNIITAAFLTRKGPQILQDAEAKGQKNAMQKFRDTIAQQNIRSKGAARGSDAKNEKGGERKFWDVVKI